MCSDSDDCDSLNRLTLRADGDVTQNDFHPTKKSHHRLLGTHLGLGFDSQLCFNLN